MFTKFFKSINLTTTARSFASSTKIVHTDLAPKAIGPYSQAVKANGFVFVSGQLGLDPKTNDFPSTTDVTAQTEMALTNMGNILKAAGSSFDKVVKTTVLVASIDDYATVNKIYAKYFTTNFPARAAFAVKTLPKHALVEIECVAVTD